VRLRGSTASAAGLSCFQVRGLKTTVQDHSPPGASRQTWNSPLRQKSVDVWPHQPFELVVAIKVEAVEQLLVCACGYTGQLLPPPARGRL